MSLIFVCFCILIKHDLKQYISILPIVYKSIKCFFFVQEVCFFCRMLGFSREFTCRCFTNKWIFCRKKIPFPFFIANVKDVWKINWSFCYLRFSNFLVNWSNQVSKFYFVSGYALHWFRNILLWSSICNWLIKIFSYMKN